MTKFANEFRRKGEKRMAPDQTTPDPSYSGGERRYLKGGRWRPDVDRCKLTKKERNKRNGKIKHSNGD